MEQSPRAMSVEEGEVDAQEVRPPLMLFLSGAALLTLALALTAVAHGYLGQRLLVDPGWPRWVVNAGHGGLGALFLSLVVGPVSGRVMRGRLAGALQWIGFFWLGTFGLTLAAVLASDLLRALLSLALRPEAAAAVEWSRIQALGVGLVVLPALWLGVWTANGRARVERVEVNLPHLPEAFEGFRIAQISDLHVGQTLGERWLSRVVAQVNALAPDAVAITGDLVDAPFRRARAHLAPLAELEATHGAFYVTGNHEYYNGGPVWEGEVARRGVTALHNEHVVLRRGDHGLVLAGVTDHDAHLAGPEHASDPARALEGAPDGVRILLAHQPRSAKRAAGLKVDLQLSGHTHGGQIFPFMFLVRLQQPVIFGLREVAGVRVYTNRGTGYWGPPIRLGAPPEITLITLKRAG